MASTCPTTARPLEDRRTELRALAGAAASLALHAALLGAAWASAPPLGETQDDEPFEQRYLIGGQQAPLPPPDTGCVAPGWCLASATWPLGLMIPGWIWEAPAEVRACFGDDGEPGGERTEVRLTPGAARLTLVGLVAPTPDPAWRSAALAIGAAVGTPQRPTMKLTQLVTKGAMSREEAQYWIAQSEARHLACYQRALRDTPWLRGRVQVELSVPASELNVEVELKGAGGVERDEALLCCLRGAQQAVVQGRWEEGPSTLRYTLELHPGGP